MVASSVLPAVVLDNVPGHVRRNGDSTCQAFFGSKTGREAGVCFWRVDQTLPRFTAVFRLKENRDKWHESSILLGDMKRNYGVVSSTVFYDRKMECVVGKEGQDQVLDKARIVLDSTTNINKPEPETKPRKSNNVWGDDMDNLDEIFQGGAVNLGSTDINSNLRTPQPQKSPREETWSPSSGFVSVSSAGSDAESLGGRSPTRRSDAGSVGGRSPPLRLPVLTNSDLLRRLVTATERQLREGEGGREGEERRVAQAVGNSWQGDVAQLERLYEQFLGDLSMDRQTLKQELSSIFSWSGSNIVGRSEALQLTEQFMVEAGSRGGVDMKTSLVDFLSENKKKYLVTKDEMLFILSRNNLDLMAVFKCFNATSKVITFRKMMEDTINISGSLFQEFSQLLIDFFISKSKKGSYEKTCSAPTAVKSQHTESNLEAALSELKISVERKDHSQALDLLAGIMKNVKGLKELKDLEEEAARVEEELRDCQEHHHEKMTRVNQDNKMLRATNTSLQARLTEALESKEATVSKLSAVCKALGSFLRGEEFEVVPAVSDDEKLVKLLSGLKKMQSDHHQGGETVSIVGSRGKTFSVLTNGTNNLCIREVERIMGRKVESFHAPALEGEGWRQMMMTGGYVICPDLGWGESVYWAKTEEDQGKTSNSQLTFFKAKFRIKVVNKKCFQ